MSKSLGSNTRGNTRMMRLISRKKSKSIIRFGKILKASEEERVRLIEMIYSKLRQGERDQWRGVVVQADMLMILIKMITSTMNKMRSTMRNKTNWKRNLCQETRIRNLHKSNKCIEKTNKSKLNKRMKEFPAITMRKNMLLKRKATIHIGGHISKVIWLIKTKSNVR